MQKMKKTYGKVSEFTKLCYFRANNSYWLKHERRTLKG